jgi:uncharacterized protein (TIGR02001 family)
MRNTFLSLSAVLLASVSAPAFADDAAPADAITITGGAAIVSDYRFRGLTQNAEEAAVQGWATVTHESGLYAGFWGSSINFSVDGVTNQSTEIDAIIGYSKEVASGVTVDGGVTYYIYPGGTTLATDLFEPYLSVSGMVGPVKAKVGAAYIWNQAATPGSQDNIYLYGDLSAAIPSTPLTVKAHYGYNDGYLGAGGNYADYMVGVDATYKNFTFGVSYVNTTGFANKAGKELAGADGAVLFTVSAAF